MLIQNNVLDSPFCILRGPRSKFLIYDIFMSLKIVFTLGNSEDPQNAILCSLSSRSALFVKVPVYR